MENLAPPGTFSAQIRPPAAASSPRVIERPIPVPKRRLTSRMATIEALEQMFELSGIEPRSAIGDRYMQAIALGALDQYLAVGG